MLAFCYLASLPALIVLHGFVVQQLWQWFIVPHFQLEPIPFITALGMGLLISYLTSQFDGWEDKQLERLVHAWLKPLLTLLIGYAYLLIFA